MRYMLLALLLAATANAGDPPLPKPGAVHIDAEKCEAILSAEIQIPEGKECIDRYGERIQAFAGTARANGGTAKMHEYFVFLVDAGRGRSPCHDEARMQAADSLQHRGGQEAQRPQGEH